jgi:SAM-dependent methyltransferase
MHTTGSAPAPAWGPQALESSRGNKEQFQTTIAADRDRWIRANRYFYDKLKGVLRFIIEPGKRVLEVRCQTGHLLAAVEPLQGVGVEISEALVSVAREKHPNLRFLKGVPEELDLDEQFDYIIFNHIFDTVDILRALERVRRICTDETRLVVVNYNPLWQPLLEWASKVGLRAPFVEPNWVNEQDLRGFLNLAGFQLIRTHRFLLFPKWLPGLSWFANDVLARLPVLRRLCLMEILVARPIPMPKSERQIAVSVVIPCRNEKGNIQAAVERIPAMGRHTEIIFGDDKSTDGTADEVRRMQTLYPEKNIRLINGPGICKAENVWACFDAAQGDVLMILDADLTVMPEELPYFFRPMATGTGEFINGSRLVYPVPKIAMKVANRIGNKLFGVVFSFLLHQRIKDTLCGTKVLWRKDWLRIKRNLGSWGLKDLWGDYELLFGASKLHLQIVEVPVHYQERVYGMTKMTRVLSNGIRMLRICGAAWARLAR